MEEHNQRKIDLIGHAMYMWHKYAAEYRTRVIKYRFYVSWKRELGISPIRAIKESSIAEYPKNSFLSILSEDEARYILTISSTSHIEKIIEDIERILNTDYTYVTLGTKIADFTYEVQHYGQEKPSLGYDPRYPSKSTTIVRNARHYRDGEE